MVNTAVPVDRGVRIRAGGGDCPLVSANRTKINNEHLSASKKVQPLEQVDKRNYLNPNIKTNNTNSEEKHHTSIYLSITKPLKR